MKYLVRFEVEYEIVVNEDIYRHDLAIIGAAVEDVIKEEMVDIIRIKPNHVEPMEAEEE